MNQKQRPVSQIESRGVHFVADLVTEDVCAEFLLDSVATDYFCNDKCLFSNFRCMSSKASIARGSNEIKGVGDISVEVKPCGTTKQVTFTNVYYVPLMIRN